MSGTCAKANILGTGRHAWRGLVVGLIAGMLLLPSANASENGASVYPVGVETVMPGMTPPPGGTMLYEYNAFISANETDNGKGKAEPINFKLRAFASAFKVSHNWGVHFLGGTVGTNFAIPFVTQELHVPPGKFQKFAVGNICVSPLGVGYVRGHWHFFYEGDIFFPGTGRGATDVLNVGQNNYAAAPVGGVTYLRGKEEISSKLQYIINLKDAATNFQTGNEFIWEFDGMHGTTRKIAVGVNGFYYQQTTGDKLNDTVFNGGNRGRDLSIGPEVRFNLIPHGGFAFKYLHDTLVQNKPPTNAFWFQIGVPISFGHKEE
jgi:hypothetical protein